MRILLLLLVLFILSSCTQKGNPKYKLSEEEITGPLTQSDYWVSTQELNMQTEDYVLVDLRSRAEYLDGHYEQALHIPLGELLEPENLKMFENPQKQFVLYANDHNRVVAPLLLLHQLGLEHIRIAAFNYGENGISPLSGQTNIDFGDLYEQALTRHQEELEASKYIPPPAVKKIVPKKKKVVEEEEEGC